MPKKKGDLRNYISFYCRTIWAIGCIEGTQFFLIGSQRMSRYYRKRLLCPYSAPFCLVGPTLEDNIIAQIPLFVEAPCIIIFLYSLLNPVSITSFTLEVNCIWKYFQQPI